MYGFNNPRRLLIGKCDLSSIVKDLGKPGLLRVLVKDPATCPGIQCLQEPSISGDVLDESCSAVRWGVDVAVVPNRQHGLQGMAHHAGHGDRKQVV